MAYSGSFQVVAMDWGIKHAMFDHYLALDTLWFCSALLLLLALMWLYTTSLFITFMTALSLLFSLHISYCIYTVIFQIHFFPFMNLLTIILILAIGSDDVFIYVKVWSLAKQEKNHCTLQKLISGE